MSLCGGDKQRGVDRVSKQAEPALNPAVVV
jgi:hypothetical protein